jgi:hypothetical protein
VYFNTGPSDPAALRDTQRLVLERAKEVHASEMGRISQSSTLTSPLGAAWPEVRQQILDTIRRAASDNYLKEFWDGNSNTTIDRVL